MEINKRSIFQGAKLGSPFALVYTNFMRRIIFFDGICPLCNGFVDFVIKRDQRHLFLFSSIQSNYAKNNLEATHLGLDSIILKENDQVFTRSTAVLRIFFQLGGYWNVLAVFASISPRWIRDYFYVAVAKNRYRIWGQREFCRLPTAEEKALFLE